MWQELYTELKDEGFMIVAVAFDSRAGAAGPWIEEASPTYVTLIDRYHHVAELYRMVNVNQAVWIDEEGTIVRPTESAGAYEGFRKSSRGTVAMPPEVAQIVADARATYHDALRDWVRKGSASEFAFTPEQARAHLLPPSADTARAHAAFTLGRYLIGIGREEEGDGLQQQASRLHPDSWNFWRQGAGLNEKGLAAQPDFWERVDALGEKKYYAAVDMKGMPQ